VQEEEDAAPRRTPMNIIMSNKLVASAADHWTVPHSYDKGRLAQLQLHTSSVQMDCHPSSIIRHIITTSMQVCV